MKVVFFLLPLGVFSSNTYAFTCYDSTGVVLNSGAGNATSSVRVDLQPVLMSGQNLVVDLSTSIFCKNDEPETRNDYVSLLSTSAYSGALTNFKGTVKYYGANYVFPLTSATAAQNLTSGNYEGWQTQLYLTPISTAAGAVIKSGDLFARLVMYQKGSNKGTGQNVHESTFTWNLYANNDVVVPTGGCDVSARDVTVTLPEYPGSAPVPLTVHCAQNQVLSYYLTGTTTDAGSTVFANTAGTSAAEGIGVQLFRNGSPIVTNNPISLGTVGTSPVSTGLSATYARTTGQVTAGNVQSVIGVTFVYQ
ncbi:fimbrial protein [Yersinia aleksiciae]|uniref:fimbrial protein n=1 Tax=Yersinia aleksiciae TaxID=263819 RepID=UPI00119DEBFA|nr:fimbrial protein [Yersinia aleksiciae]MDN0124312.1 fimbrial protein [Yersinia aleksiciae]